MNRISRLSIYGELVLITISIIFVTGLIGCANRTVDSDTTMTELPKSFSRPGEKPLEKKWWKKFDDKNLDKLIDRALEDNFSLKQSWNRLKEARAVVDSQSSRLYPGLDVTGSESIDRRKRSSSSPSQTSTTSRLKAVANYEVDLWNRIESSVEASEYSQKASREQLRSAAISLSAEVARTWYQLINGYKQVEILKNQLQVNRDFHKIVSNRYSYGVSRLADVLRQRRLKQGTRKRLIARRSEVKVLENKLAVLLGNPPKKTVNPKIEQFPDLPSVPQTGIPSETINQRPDVKAAFYQVKSADREVASAIANQYPRLNLTGSVRTDGADAGTLFENWLQSIAADLTVPLIDADKRESEVKRTEAVLSRRLNDYKETVLTAFKEVEDAIVNEEHQRDQMEKIQKQLETSRQTVEILRNRYANGGTDFLSVLDAIQTKQKLQRDLARGKRKLIIDRIGLYRALSGGWSMDRPDDNATSTTNQGA